MVLLAQASITTLKEIPSKLWSKAIEQKNHAIYLFDIIGTVKTFNETNVRLTIMNSFYKH